MDGTASSREEEEGRREETKGRGMQSGGMKESKDGEGITAGILLYQQRRKSKFL